MASAKIGGIVAGVLVALLGVVGLTAMRSDGGTEGSNTVAGPVAGESTVPNVAPVATPAPATQPAPAAGPKAPPATKPTATTRPPANGPAATATPPSIPRTPQEIQQFIAGITAQLQASAVANGGTAPVTKEQIDAQVRAQLRQLGINL
jgi:hypothetical protein